MNETVELTGDMIVLRCIRQQDCTENYVRWLNDTDVNKYLETRWTNQNLQTVQDFVRQALDSDNSVLFAITIKETGRHIGNIKIGPVNWNHKYADISYFIGEKDCWGKGYAREAIALIVNYGFINLGLHKICAGYYDSNTGSQKALCRNGFVVEGVFKEQLVNVDGMRENAIRVSLLKEDYPG